VGRSRRADALRSLHWLMWFEDESIVVESEDGRHKARPIDHVPPEEAAKQTLIELEQERSPAVQSQDRRSGP
jgi:hypothetical protein